MNTAEYFKIQSKNNILYLKLKNRWNDQVAISIGDDFKRDYTRAVDSFGGQAFYSLIELAPEFKPVAPKVKELMSFGMMYSNTHNLLRSVQIMPDPLQRLGLQDAAKEAKHDDFRIIVASLEEGLKKIEELKAQ
ncbi:hypothetical protein [Carboxylicivirga sp. M1479]|uniref:hypothetical protein n=1 Tax=Carboxylicivirga sp. M1479 TaxID=2594476 RepID=UPI001177341C|nr:hypothetical protein [Carboxylicivirga sp. M1479]TRX71232.1 hypothetical protein FNN09_07415 [Carboxylicivirga sp. M1479]